MSGLCGETILFGALVLQGVEWGRCKPRKSYTPYILQFYTESLSGEIKQPSPYSLRGIVRRVLTLRYK